MNKKKNQTSIDLDAIMTEVLNLFTPEEQQEVIDILSNNGLEKIYQQMEETFYHYQHPDYSSEATPIAAYLQRFWDMQTCKDYPFDEFNTSVIIASRSIEVWFFFLFIIVSFNKFVNFLQRYTSLLSNSLIISLFFKYSFRRR